MPEAYEPSEGSDGPEPAGEDSEEAAEDDDRFISATDRRAHEIRDAQGLEKMSHMMRCLSDSMGPTGNGRHFIPKGSDVVGGIKRHELDGQEGGKAKENGKGKGKKGRKAKGTAKGKGKGQANGKGKGKEDRKDTSNEGGKDTSKEDGEDNNYRYNPY
jgi:hypothetical protein